MRTMALQHRRWIQRKAQARAEGNAKIPEGGGRPLDSAVRRTMEGQLGADLSSVQVHTGGESARAANQLGARAFTVDQHVHFNDGEFAPGSKEGDRLLAHELTHVVQGQKSGIRRKAAEDDGASDGESEEQVDAGAETETPEGSPVEAESVDESGETEGDETEGDQTEGDEKEGGEDEVSEPSDASEQEADAAGDQVADALHGEGGEGGEEKPQDEKQGDKKPEIGAAAAKTSRKVILRKDKPGKPSSRGTAKAGDPAQMVKDMKEALKPSPFIHKRLPIWQAKIDKLKESKSNEGADLGEATLKNAVQKSDEEFAAKVARAFALLSRLLEDLANGGDANVKQKLADTKKKRDGAYNFEVRQWCAEYQAVGKKDLALKVEGLVGQVDLKIEAMKAATDKAAGQDEKAGAELKGGKEAAGAGKEAKSADTKDAGKEAKNADAKDAGKEAKSADAKDGNAEGAFKPAIDPCVDPVGALREFIAAGKGWPDIKKAFGENEPQMTAMFQLRRNIVDPLLDEVCKEKQCGKEANGSANLTSDYDLSLFPLKDDGNPAEAVAEFNSRFREQWGMESGTIFDTNVYDKGEAMSSKAGDKAKGAQQLDPKIQELEKSADFQQGNDRIQDVAALVKIRKYMDDKEWNGYKEQLERTAPEGKQQEMAARLLAAETQYATNKKRLDDHVKKLMKLPEMEPMPEEIPPDVALEASNLEYATALAKVQEARKERTDALIALKATPQNAANPALQQKVIAADVKIREAMASSLDFANEAYNSEGALIDVVGVQQGAFKGMDVDPKQIQLSPQEMLSSFNEQFGDALKDLHHYGHPSKEEEAAEKRDPDAKKKGEDKRFVKAMVQVSKYVMRMVDAAEQICGLSSKGDAKEPIPAKLMTELADLKKTCGGLKDLRGDPKIFEDKKSQVKGMINPDDQKHNKPDEDAHVKEGPDEGGINPQYYGIEITSLEVFKGLLLQINLDVNEVGRSVANVGNKPPEKKAN
jgi:hypothetical protein